MEVWAGGASVLTDIAFSSGVLEYTILLETLLADFSEPIMEGQNSEYQR